MSHHNCPSVTVHRGPSFVCQSSGHGVNQDSYCKNCTYADEAIKPTKRFKDESSHTEFPISSGGCMSTKETGGPAFPCLDSNANGHEGLTMRDYFAAKALQGLLADPNAKGLASVFAKDAYMFADAMLKARAHSDTEV